MKKLLRILSCMSAIALATADPPSQAQISSNKLFVVNTNNVLPQNETNFFTKNAPLFSAWPNTIYVSAAGSDSNPGTNLLFPVLTLTNAFQIASNLGGSNLIAFGLGTFMFPHLTVMPQNICLSGMGPDLTTLDFPWTQDYDIGLILSGSNNAIRNLTLGHCDTTNFHNFSCLGALSNMSGNFSAEKVVFKGDSDNIHLALYPTGNRQFRNPITNLWNATFTHCTFCAGENLCELEAGGVGTNSQLFFNDCFFTNAAQENYPTPVGFSLGSLSIVVKNCRFDLGGTNNTAIYTHTNLANVYLSGNSFVSPSGTNYLSSYAGTFHVQGPLDPNLIILGSTNFIFDNTKFSALTAANLAGDGAAIVNIQSSNVVPNSWLYTNWPSTQTNTFYTNSWGRNANVYLLWTNLFPITSVGSTALTVNIYDTNAGNASFAIPTLGFDFGKFAAGATYITNTAFFELPPGGYFIASNQVNAIPMTNFVQLK